MTGHQSSPPPGWYPTPEGGQRYWDGSRWLALPAPDANTAQPQRRRLITRRWLLGAVGVLVIAAVVTVGLVMKAERDRELLEAQEIASERAAAEQAAAREAAEAEEAASAEAAELRAQQALEQAELDARQETVEQVEASIEEMASGHADDGILDGEALEVACSPVAGGSIDDLTEETTVLECFVATEDNGDGTMSGYYYNSTVNWTTGRYTYGLGAP